MARSRHRPRVLAADGDGEMLSRTALRLERAGYDVLLAHDGEEALARALGERPDVCVLDAMLPGLSGYDVTRRLRADSRTATLPVLLITALPLQASAFDPGAAYLRKPFSLQQLPDRIADLLAGDPASAKRRSCG